MMRKKRKGSSIFLVLAGLLVAATPLWSAEPQLFAVEFHGNRFFSARRLLDFTGLNVGQKITAPTLETASDKLLEQLALEGFYFSRIDSLTQTWRNDSTQIVLAFYLTESERLILKEMTFTGDSLRLSDNFLPQTKDGHPVYHESLEADLWDYLQAQEESGHPLARLDVQAMQVEADSLTLRARMISGPTVTLQSVQIAGLEHTKPKVVAREARISSGELYRPSKIARAQQRMRNLPFIEEVSEPALLSLGSNRYDLLFTVKEARANSFDGVIGYQPGSQGQKGQVTGLLNLTLQNLFGTGRKAKINWEQTSSSRQALDLYYEEPWVAGWPFNLWIGVHQEIQDTLYLTRSFSGGVTWPLLEVLTLGGSIFQEETWPDSSGRVYLGLYQSRSRGAALQVDYDTRDYLLNPTQGLYYRSYASAAQKEYEAVSPQGNVDVRHYESDADWSYRLWGRQILNLQVYGRVLQSDERPIPEPDLYRLGGALSLRGYREDQFLGSIVGWTSLEYRLWLDKRSRIYAFFNLGYWERETEVPQFPGSANLVLQKEHDWPWGYGVGFRQGTGIGIIGFDFALGQDDVLATAKVHFRLINQF